MQQSSPQLPQDGSSIQQGFTMEIAIVGMGAVGSTLGERWANLGHRVTFCVRDPDSPEKVRKASSLAAAVQPLSRAADSEAILLAVPWTAIDDVLSQLGDLTGRIILDCVNPVDPDLTRLTLGFSTSAGEEIARRLPGARVVKIFNTNGVRNMANPHYRSHCVTMLYAGDHPEANAAAASLAEEIGLEPIYFGPLETARLLEPLAMAWITLARHRDLGRDIALDLIRRPSGAVG